MRRRYSVRAAGGAEETLFGVHDPLRGVAVGAGHGVDGRTVGPPQLGGLLSAIQRREPGQEIGIKDFVDEEVDQLLDLFGRKLDGADLALGLGADVPRLPGRPAALQHRHDVVGSLGDPAGVGTAAPAPRLVPASLRPSRRQRATAEDLGGFGHPYPALLGFGCGVHASRHGFPGWPAGPGAGPRPE